MQLPMEAPMRTGKAQGGGSETKGSHKLGKKGVPMVVVGNVACDGSGFHAPSLQTTTERQNVIGEAEGLVGRTGPGQVMPVALEIHTCESDQ